ncbi:hypothetical protein BC939DRAFT_481267 [Gamsiella multidivaricata]|uniref:uncharacterized protein n=1 Tax=Gamsiella multidivaricata TaxID=101098 RepID=UPI00222064A0|nr:uncharacterized protein BC939DRAFT_481267 [Gamsiella multidivaricata]KAI7817327.1 hypothetical protein BC939DRAFT_481267 [Gamsiella multidivaricata]
MVTKNNYFDGISGLGITRNSQTIKSLRFKAGERKNSVTCGIRQYLVGVGCHSNKTLVDYRHVLMAFALCQEHGSPDATPSSQPHNDVYATLVMFEQRRLVARQKVRQSRTRSPKEHDLGTCTKTNEKKMRKFKRCK